MNASLFPHLLGVKPHPDFQTLEDQAAAAEAWETDRWSPHAVLKVELLTSTVVDPCVGTGILAEAAKAHGCPRVICVDKYDWGYPCIQKSWLDVTREDLGLKDGEDFTVFMNPPFSLACEFVNKAFELGARKVICYQRQAWRECQDRREWWEENPPARVWVCGDRSHSWLFHIPPESRKGGRFMPAAYYVWERGHKGAEIGGAIWKDMAR